MRNHNMNRVIAAFKDTALRNFRNSGLYKAIFNQLAKAINALGRAVGGDTGDAVSSAINTAISILIGFEMAINAHFKSSDIRYDVNGTTSSNSDCSFHCFE